MPPIHSKFASVAAQRRWIALVEGMKSPNSARWQEHDAPYEVFEGCACKTLRLEKDCTAYEALGQNSFLADGTLASLTFTVQVFGAVPNDDFPVYIGMHGGGGAATENEKGYKDAKASNNGAWRQMTDAYKSFTSGIWISLRGIGDSWDMHFTSGSYVLIERLIENLILFGVKKDDKYLNVNANRIYLIGFSAGGDGVYRLGMHLTQRFAAINMGGGHRGDTKFTNHANLPICLQVGEQDCWYGGRSNLAAKAGRDLQQLRAEYRASVSESEAKVYAHDVFLHVTAKDKPEPPARDLWNNWKSSDSDDIYSHRHFMWENKYFNWFKPADATREASEVIWNVDAWLTEYDQSPDFFNVVNGWADVATTYGPRTPGRRSAFLNTNPIDWLNQYVRTSIPKQIVWDLFTDRQSNDNFKSAIYANTSGMRATAEGIEGRRQFYWLDIGAFTPTPSSETIIKARREAKENKIIIDQISSLRYLRILLRPDMMAKPNEPVKVHIWLSNPVKLLQLTPVKVLWDNPAVIEATIWRKDPNFIFTGDIVLTKDDTGNWSAVATPFQKTI